MRGEAACNQTTATSDASDATTESAMAATDDAMAEAGTDDMMEKIRNVANMIEHRAEVRTDIAKFIAEAMQSC